MNSTKGSTKGSRLDEPALGQDMVYDGAADSRSTSFLFGPNNGRFAVKQNYGSSFNSVTPRPWQRPTPSKYPILGPGQYTPSNDTHLLAATMSWQSRGRSGPTGSPFDANRRSLPFRQSTGRMGLAAARPGKRGALLKEDVFVLASDARKEHALRTDFASQLHGRVLMQSQPPLSRAGTSPGF